MPNLVTSVQALQRVFHLPCIRISTGRLPRASNSIDTYQKRHWNGYRGRGPSQPLSNQGPPDAPPAFPRDEGIRSREVRVVDQNRSLQEPQPLADVLSSINRATHTLIQVSPIDSDEIPVCKIISKMEVREAEKARAKPVKDVSTMTKQLEIGWGIDSNDISHRMKKMAEFLSQGRRVDIVLANKRRRKPPTPDKASALLRVIRQKIADIDGAKEWKSMDGAVGVTATLYVEGKAKK